MNSGISLPGARWRHILRAPLPALLRLFLISSFYDSSCFSFFYYLLFLRSHVILNKLHATRRYRAEPIRQIRRLRLAAKRRDVFHDETELRTIRGELINVKSINCITGAAWEVGAPLWLHSRPRLLYRTWMLSWLSLPRRPQITHASRPRVLVSPNDYTQQQISCPLPEVKGLPTTGPRSYPLAFYTFDYCAVKREIK